MISVQPNSFRRACGILGLLLAWVSPGAPRGACGAEDDLRHFESRVRPLLVDRCGKCHGAKTQWGSLRLDSRAAILKGGDTGPALVPGQPDQSLLLKAVRGTDPDLQMPPEGEKPLTAVEIADLTTWIQRGAVFPESPTAGSPKRDPQHWAFQRPQTPPVPAVQDATWSQTRVDPFILARLEAESVAPAPAADRRTLVRRLTFDLTGLPPVPDEIDEFLADERPDATARLVDRLMASPAYGERWGRHWLDVARYADSNGLDENVAHGNAWRYRDYVIQAWNADLPYDRFVLEQLAGDLIPAEDWQERNRLRIATGFLALGPKVLAEVDEVKMQMDIVDEQIDTVGRSLLGLTFGCARCHDHKFDPIETADYYALAGVFKSTRTMEHFRKVARWFENPLDGPESERLKAAHAARLAVPRSELQQAREQAEKQIRESLPPGKPVPDNLETMFPPTVQAELKRLRDEIAKIEKDAPELPSAMGATEAQVTDVAIHIRGNPLKLGAVVPRRIPTILKTSAAVEFPDHQSGRWQLAQSFVSPDHPLTARVIVNRIWRWHFGRGLVATADNFGLLGEAPTHPELLDDLARQLIRANWSLKWLHRQIVLSATFQTDSVASQALVERDPENLWFGRARTRRLEAEAIRDALLAVAGQLDTTMGGSLLTVKNRAYFFDHTSRDLTDYSSTRRSLYLPVVRNNVYDVLQLLDYPDAAVPSGDRTTSTVAPQALLMLNSELALQASRQLAVRIMRTADASGPRVRLLYRLTLGRDPTPAEITESQRLVESIGRMAGPQQDPDLIGWSSLCQVVLASNEFFYLR